MAEVAIVGGGPAGLMAAEVLAGAGHRVTVHDAMPSPARSTGTNSGGQASLLPAVSANGVRTETVSVATSRVAS